MSLVKDLHTLLAFERTLAQMGRTRARDQGRMYQDRDVEAFERRLERLEEQARKYRLISRAARAAPTY